MYRAQGSSGRNFKIWLRFSGSIGSQMGWEYVFSYGKGNENY
jgi:hypothetical protein